METNSKKVRCRLGNRRDHQDKLALNLAYKEKMHYHGAMYVGRIIQEGAVSWRLDVSGVMRLDIMPEIV